MANKRAENPTQKTLKYRMYREAHPNYDAEWREKNREKLRRQQKEYYQRNIEAQRARALVKNKKRKEEQPERLKEYLRRQDIKRFNDIPIRVHRYVGNAVRHSLLRGAKNNRRLETILGYKIKTLQKHLERKFQYGMTWENYGEWHIDHIVPVSAFNFEKPEDIDFKRCWSLKNLQPLWAIDNIKKRNKLSKPFQPSLLLEA